MVPDIIKWQRNERIEECTLMAHAIQVMQYLNGIVGQKKFRKINDMVTKRKDFMQWSAVDPHRKRRMAHSREVKVKQSEMAKTRKVPLLQLLNQPFEDQTDVTMRWIPLADLPEDLIDHSKACINYQLMKVPQPVTGIEVFRSRIVSHELVFRAIDPNHTNPFRDGLEYVLIGDFTKVDWRGWQCINTKHESYYSPTTFNGFDEQERHILPEPWDRIDLLVRPPKKKGTARPKRLGSIEDVQVCRLLQLCITYDYIQLCKTYDYINALVGKIPQIRRFLFVVDQTSRSCICLRPGGG